MAEVIFEILCFCCRPEFCDFFRECCSKCFELPGHCLASIWYCIKNSCSGINLACFSNIFCACWKCTETDCSKIFNNSFCDSMEESCLKVFNCTESISGCSNWFHDFWLARVRCSLWVMRGICNCMPDICLVTVGLHANASDDEYSKGNNATNSDNTHKRKRSKNAEIQEINPNEENGYLDGDNYEENNHEIMIVNEDDEVLR